MEAGGSKSITGRKICRKQIITGMVRGTLLKQMEVIRVSKSAVPTLPYFCTIFRQKEERQHGKERGSETDLPITE